jgi:hypothetical protein
VAVRNHRLAALALFSALTVLHTWPLATDPGRWSRLDSGDAAHGTWTVTWVADVVGRAPFRLFEAPIFYPESHTLAYSEHLLVPSMMGAPLLWLGASPVLVYNLLIMLGLTLSAWSMYLLITQWTGSLTAGLLSGLIYGFNAYVLTQIPRLLAQHVEFFPLMLYALDRVLLNGRRAVPLLAFAFVLQSLCSNHLLVFGAAAMVVSVAVRPRDWWGLVRASTWGWLMAAAVSSVLMLAPFLWPYYQVRRDMGLQRELWEVELYSATWQSYLTTGGRLHYAWWSHEFFAGHTALFPGLIAATLALLAVVTGKAVREPRARMALAFGILGVTLSFGTNFPGYSWLHGHVPLLNGIRAADRWGWLGLTAIAVLSGYMVSALETRWQRARIWPAVVAGLAIGVTVEALRTPMSFTRAGEIPRVYDLLAREASVVLVEFPIYSDPNVVRNAPYLLYNTRYLRPLVNGYSSFEPPTFTLRARQLANFPDQSAVTLLRELGVTHVTIHHAAFVRRSGEPLAAVAESLPDLELLDRDGDVSLYRLRAKASLAP